MGVGESKDRVAASETGPVFETGPVLIADLSNQPA